MRYTRQQYRADRNAKMLRDIDVERQRAKRTVVEILSATSPLETKFTRYWIEALRGPVLEREFKFHPTRGWRFDFAHVATKTAFELEGGVYGFGKPCPVCGLRKRGAHSSTEGMMRDLEKYNEAALLGWTVFRLTEDMIKLGADGRGPRLGCYIQHINHKLMPGTVPAYTPNSTP